MKTHRRGDLTAEWTVLLEQTQKLIDRTVAFDRAVWSVAPLLGVNEFERHAVDSGFRSLERVLAEITDLLHQVVGPVAVDIDIDLYHPPTTEGRKLQHAACTNRLG